MAENCTKTISLEVFSGIATQGLLSLFPQSSRRGAGSHTNAMVVQCVQEGQQRDRIALTLVRVVVGLVGTSDFQGWLPSIVELKRRMRQD